MITYASRFTDLGQQLYIMIDKNRVGDIFQEFIVQELWESRGGRPGLSVLTSLLVSVDVKIY